MNEGTWLQDRRMKKFADVLKRWERKELSAEEAGELLGCLERQFRRYRRRYEEEREAGLVDRRLGKASFRRVPIDKVSWMLSEYRTRHIERFRIIDGGKALEAIATVDDPGAFTMPWRAMQRYRCAERGPMGEQVCAENNVDFFDYRLDPIPTADKSDF
jgi:hypothetical protein